jgi:hypothetical protein
VTIPVANRINGTKNKASIIMDLTYMVVLPFLLSLFALKYAFTRRLNVFEKSEFNALENFGLSILLYLN